MIELITYQRGESLRMVRVFRESTDGGTTWSRIPLTGKHYARDIRKRSTEDGTLLLSIRDDDAHAYATLEADAVQLDGESVASAVGVVVVDVPAAVATAALPAGSWPTDEALVDSDGEPVYLGRGKVVSSPRVTVLS